MIRPCISLRIGAFIVANLAGPAFAQEGAINYARGELLAEAICSLCHDVTTDQSSNQSHEAPSFVAIANKPNQTSDSLTATILFPHRDMPEFTFETPTDLRDIIGYILSMKVVKYQP